MRGDERGDERGVERVRENIKGVIGTSGRKNVGVKG